MNFGQIELQLTVVRHEGMGERYIGVVERETGVPVHCGFQV